ncbi:MAG: O-antigen ligase family protein, partial [Candidatus Eremiobacteraeota bacterium]|nr:O-antigen ligase family protein [Candidatus Eremiobacteraeota bacterium]
MRRFFPLAFASVYAALPLYPSFIALTSVTYPGVSVVPKPLVYATLALVGLLVAYASTMLLRYRKAGAQPLLLPLIVWLASALLSAIVGFDPLRGLMFVCIFGTGIVWHWSLLRFYGDVNVAGAIFWSYLISGTLAAAVAIVMVAARTPAALYALQHGRATGTFVLPGELAAYLIVLLPIAYALARTARGAALRALAWTSLTVGLVALAMTYSRAGWMGAAAAAAFLVAMQTGRGRRGGAMAFVTVLAGAAVVLLLFNSHHDPSEDYTRLSIWQAALQIVDRFPLTGVGPFDFPLVYPLVHVPDADATAFHAHNLYLTFLAEGGVLMLAAFLWGAWRFAFELRARIASAAPVPMQLSLAATAGLV